MVAGGCETSAAGLAHRARVQHYRAAVGNHMKDLVSAKAAAGDAPQLPRSVQPLGGTAGITVDRLGWGRTFFWVCWVAATCARVGMEALSVKQREVSA